MGYTGRPGPLVSEWGAGIGDSLFVCGGMDSSGKGPSRKFFASLGEGSEATDGCVLQHSHPLFSLTGTTWESWTERRIWRPRPSGDSPHPPDPQTSAPHPPSIPTNPAPASPSQGPRGPQGLMGPPGKAGRRVSDLRVGWVWVGDGRQSTGCGGLCPLLL